MNLGVSLLKSTNQILQKHSHRICTSPKAVHVIKWTSGSVGIPIPNHPQGSGICWRARAQDTSLETAEENGPVSVGEDAATFRLSEQRFSSWAIFGALLSSALAALYVLWINPSFGYSDEFLSLFKSVSSTPEVIITLLLLTFSVTHSGLAALRPLGEKWIGPRAFRVVFAATSLPLAAITIGYFINHRYGGTQLWMVQDIIGIRQLVWLINFISFFFLYPSTFNLLEIAAVDRPQLHLWETGVTRITRHPQAFGQALWCMAHTLWIGNMFTVVTSAGLMLHHAFGCWHGDQRLAAKHGQAFEELKSRTSILPFQAIFEGRQRIPDNYYKEFLRVPYLAITVLTIGAYVAHPLMFRSVYSLGW